MALPLEALYKYPNTIQYNIIITVIMHFRYTHIIYILAQHIHIYTHTYIYNYTCIYVHTYTYIHTHLHMYKNYQNQKILKSDGSCLFMKPLKSSSQDSIRTCFATKRFTNDHKTMTNNHHLVNLKKL